MVKVQYHLQYTNGQVFNNDTTMSAHDLRSVKSEWQQQIKKGHIREVWACAVFRDGTEREWVQSIHGTTEY